MARRGQRIWTVEVRETHDYTVTVREEDLDLPADASDDTAEEAAANRAVELAGEGDDDATSCNAEWEAGRVELQA